MKEMIGYCGYNCHLCAACSDDKELRQKMVDGWRKIFGLEMYTAENVCCDGCKSIPKNIVHYRRGVQSLYETI